MIFNFGALLCFLLAHPAVAFSPPAALRTNINTVDSSSSSSSSSLQAVWSDSKAVREYQDFLASGEQEITLKEDGPSVIMVSPNEAELEYNQLNPLAQALMHMGRGDDIILSPYQTLPDVLGEGEYATSEYPIYITLPPQEILPFLDNVDDAYKERNEDFCFFSGGFQFGNIEDTLKERGYCRDTMTQILISGMEIGEEGIKDVSVSLGPDSVGEDKLAGECSACGKWNGAIAKRLERSSVTCKTEFYRDWRRKMWERSCMDAVFNLIGSVRADPTTLSDVANYYEEEASDMLWEISGHLRAWKAVTLTYGFEERLFGFAERRSDQQCTIVDDWYQYIWGNKVFSSSKKFLEYLHYAKNDMGYLQTVDLPPMKEETELELASPSRLRTGNLRADGVI